MRYYDKHHKRLIYIAETASPEYWDHHWESKNLRAEITKKHFDQLVIPTTKKYLAPGSRVLEGGCGTGVHVFGLRQNGFESIGVDNAPETVRLAKEAVPEMDIRLGDVLTLDFEDNYFDGYWSIGVIEHFWDGYEPVLSEMKRLLKPGGYLFLTFPYMSPLRKWKARRGQYPMHEHMRSLDSPFGLARDDRGVIDGVFDGKQMVADDGTLYPVPENYASKSKLLEGDLLQLVKTPDGRNYFKQTSRVPRRIKQARLVHIEASHGFVRTDDGGSYQILLAPLRFFRVNPGEQLTIEVPETGGVWAAVVGKIESWYTSQTYAGTVPNV